METTENLSPGSPAEAVDTTSGGATSLGAAMTVVLKAVKPLDVLVKAQAQAIARRNALWEIFKPMCVLPDTSERSLLERFLLTAEKAYLAWLEAYEACEGHKRTLQQAEQELQAAQDALKAAVAAAEGLPELKEDKTLAAAAYMLALLKGRHSQVDGEVKEQRVTAEFAAADEIPMAKLRNAAIAIIATEVQIAAKHEALLPLVSDVYAGAQLENVPLPVRPLEEEIVRYLSSLENNLQRQQELHRRAQPLLKERLALIEQFDAWEKAWTDAVAEIEALDRPALRPHIWAVKKIVTLVCEHSEKSKFARDYRYDNWVAKTPESLVTNDRPSSTAVEKDQIDYLRKQMRVVAFAIAHRAEATYTLKNFKGDEVKVSPAGVQNVGGWSDCLAWYEDLRAKRAAAELESLSRSTKVELLKSTVEHFDGKVKDEMTALYKTFNAMIPRNGPLPSNELRKLLDQAAFICKPLEKTRDYDY